MLLHCSEWLRWYDYKVRDSIHVEFRNGEPLEHAVQRALVALADGSILRNVLALLVQEKGQPAILQSIHSAAEPLTVALWSPLLQLIQRLLNLSGHKTQLLTTLAFSTDFVTLLWKRIIQTHHVQASWPRWSSHTKTRGCGYTLG